MHPRSWSSWTLGDVTSQDTVPGRGRGVLGALAAAAAPGPTMYPHLLEHARRCAGRMPGCREHRYPRESLRARQINERWALVLSVPEKVLPQRALYHRIRKVKQLGVSPPPSTTVPIDFCRGACPPPPRHACAGNAIGAWQWQCAPHAHAETSSWGAPPCAPCWAAQIVLFGPKTYYGILEKLKSLIRTRGIMNHTMHR